MDLFDIAIAKKLAGGGGGGGGTTKSGQIAYDIKVVNSGKYVDTGLNLTVAKSGIYNVYWEGWRTTQNGTSGSQLVVDGTDYGEAQEQFDSSLKSIQRPFISNVELAEGQVVSLKAKAYNMQYNMYVMNLTIIEV